MVNAVKVRNARPTGSPERKFASEEKGFSSIPAGEWTRHDISQTLLLVETEEEEKNQKACDLLEFLKAQIFFSDARRGRTRSEAYLQVRRSNERGGQWPWEPPLPAF